LFIEEFVGASFGKRVALEKKRNNISPGAPSGSCLPLSPFFHRGQGLGGGEIRGNE